MPSAPSTDQRRDHRTPANQLLALGVIVATAVGAYLVLGDVGRRVGLVARGHLAEATIVGVVQRPGMDDCPVHHPVVDFVTRYGQTRTGVVLRDTYGSSPTIGATIRIVYDPDRPQWAESPGWGQGAQKLAGSVVLVVAAIGCVSGLLR